MSYSLKTIREEFRKNGVFYTPKELAEYMKSFIDFEVEEVYDPTCGHGGLLAVWDDEIKKYGQDINELGIEFCNKNIPNFYGSVGSVLTEPAFKDKKFKCIMGNPPFSIKWEQDTKLVENFKNYPKDKKGRPVLPPNSKADYAFNLHILDMLADDGKAIVMNFPGVLYRGAGEGTIRQWLVEQNYIEAIIHIAGGKFEDTTVATCLIIFNKAKKDTNIKFVDTENELEYIASFEEIKANDFKLSVSNYIQKEEIKEEIDIDKLNFEIALMDIKKLDESLNRQLFLIQILNSNIDYLWFIGEIEKLCKKYKKKFLNNEKAEFTIEQLLLFSQI